MTLAARRAGVIAAVVAVLVTVGVLDSHLARVGAAAPVAVATSGADTVVPAGPGSGSWFCAGGSGPGADAEESVVVTNPTAQIVTGTVTAIPEGKRPRSIGIQVVPGGLTSVTPADVASGPWVAAAVLLDHPGVEVTETVSTPLGWSTAPCASATATNWYLTGLSTAGQDGVSVSILNPSVTPAVVDTTLVTSAGQSLKPAAYQGVTVAPDSLFTEYLSDHDEGDPDVSTDVTAVSGSVVVAALQSFTGSEAQGVAVDLAASSTSTSWAFPSSEQIPGARVSYVVYNPGRSDAHVQMAVDFDQGTASPIGVVVPAGQAEVVQASSQPQVPVGTPFAARFTSSTGVVVARDVRSPSGGGSPEQGLGLGVPAGSRQWLVPPVTAPGLDLWSIAVQDLAGRPVSVTVSGVSSTGAPVAVTGLSDVSVTPGQPLIASGSVSAPLGAVPATVTASGPVAVEVDPEPVGSPGVVVLPTEPVG